MVDEVRAEYLLTQLYPELDETWVARHKGTFFRNYSSDMMKVYPMEKLTELSRDGLLQLLPNTFLSDEDELKGAGGLANQKRVKQRLHTLEEAFLPVDSIRFQQSLQIERATQPLLEMKMEYILREYFAFDITKETNPYILQVATLLPFVNVLRGDIQLIRTLMRTVLEKEVEMDVYDYSADDTNVRFIPHVRYRVMADDMSQEDYMAFLAQLSPFMDFLTDHFLPFDLRATVSITGSNDREQILEYNTIIR